MTDIVLKKITAVDAIHTVAPADIMLIVTGIGTTPATKSIQLAEVGIINGWIGVPNGWTYASATTINVPAGAALIYAVGDKIRLTQSAAVKYFIVSAVANTLLTVFGGSDYTVADAAISAISYSKVDTPVGFPAYFNYMPTWTNLTAGDGTYQARKISFVGRRAEILIELTLGASSSVGTNPNVSLPIDAVNRGVWNLLLYDTGVQNYIGMAYGQAGVVYLFKIGNYTNNFTYFSGITATSPFTWATGDKIWLTGAYNF